MRKKFEVNRTRIKGGCQSERKAAEMPLANIQVTIFKTENNWWHLRCIHHPSYKLVVPNSYEFFFQQNLRFKLGPSKKSEKNQVLFYIFLYFFFGYFFHFYSIKESRFFWIRNLKKNNPDFFL